MKDEIDYKNYLTRSQELAALALHDPFAKEELLQTIHRYINEPHQQQLYNHFFKAEQAFYQGHYELSLKQYLLCRGLEDFPFYCYRASAYVSKNLNQLEKSKKFVEKALSLRPEDPYTLAALSEPQKESIQEMQVEIPVNSDFNPIIASNENHSTETTAPQLYQVSASSNPLDALQKMSCSVPISQKSLSAFSQHEEVLEQRIRDYQSDQTNKILSYVENAKSRNPIPDDCLVMLSGWMPKKSSHLTYGNALGGFFIRWEGKGIVVNPGTHFLTNFHKKGLSIKDIDFVLVTRSEPESYADIENIYSLNNQINKINPELQVIHYYLNHKAFQDLSPVLKPHYKQERNSLHQLEIYLDSPDTETVELAPNISLNYFAMQDPLSVVDASPLGIRFDLRKANKNIRIGYLSGAKWTPLLSHHTGACEILITGFGNTCSSDYGRLKYNDDCLGFYGTFSLLEEVTPHLLLCTEFAGREGDIRLEVVRKLRADLENHHPSSRQKTIILPADSGLKISLIDLAVECSLTKENIEASDAKIVRSSNGMGELHYLAQHNCL